MEMLKRPPSGRSSHTFPQGIIFEELEDCLGQSVTIIPLDEKTGLMVSYGFNDAAATRGDDRRTGRHRFDRRAAERFVPDGREHEHIRVVIVIDQFRPR